MILPAIFSCTGCTFELPGWRWQLVGSPETTFYLCPPGPGRPGVPGREPSSRFGLLVSIFFLSRFILRVWTSCLHRGHQRVWLCRSYRWLWAALWVLGIELGSSERAVRVPNSWVISPAPHFCFLCHGFEWFLFCLPWAGVLERSRATLSPLIHALCHPLLPTPTEVVNGSLGFIFSDYVCALEVQGVASCTYSRGQYNVADECLGPYLGLKIDFNLWFLHDSRPFLGRNFLTVHPSMLI